MATTKTKGFDLAAVLSRVSDTDTESARHEVIEYLPLDRIDPDPQNFYSLDGISELADNIATIGLQQPLRVRTGDGGHVTVVSGHRRRAALLLLQDGEDNPYPDGVPCIREQKEGSAALAELRLIYANCATRRMTPTDIQQQAERVSELLYRLKEEGFDFPGRMRDHVAAACGVSRTKLARLNAIKANLMPEIYSGPYTAGEITESVAYTLSKLSPERQSEILNAWPSDKPLANLSENRVEDISRDIDRLKALECGEYKLPGCQSCEDRIAHIYRNGYRNYDCPPDACCLSCSRLENCTACCERAKKKRRELKEQTRTEREKAKIAEAEKAERREEARKRNLLYQQELFAREKALRLEAGIDAEAIIRATIPNVDGSLLSYLTRRHEQFERGESDNSFSTPFGDVNIDDIRALCAAADMLDCSIDEMLGRAAHTPTAPEQSLWRSGTPDHDGRYLAVMSMNGAFFLERMLNFSGGEWSMDGTYTRIADNITVDRWVEIPPDPERKD